MNKAKPDSLIAAIRKAAAMAQPANNTRHP
jgi:hypothetical protein